MAATRHGVPAADAARPTGPAVGTTATPAAEPAGPPGTATRLFLEHRERLFSVVYALLGSVADTEDVLQETWLSWSGRNRRAPLAGIDSPGGYLVRVAVNHALARRAAVAHRRETYVGPWLPEPLPTDPTVGPAPDAAERAVRTESVSLAMLVVLETLTPLERAVFVLHEVFGYPHTQIAGMLDRSAAAVRQLAHRARAHVRARRPRYRVHPRVRRQATERFVTAALGGDLAALLEILAPDVTVWIDGGGSSRTAGLRPVHGKDRAARMLAGYATRRAAGRDIRYRNVNGDSAAVLFAGDAPYAVMVMDLTPEGDQVSGVYIVTNPEKLGRLRADAPDDAEPEHGADRVHGSGPDSGRDTSAFRRTS